MAPPFIELYLSFLRKLRYNGEKRVPPVGRTGSSAPTGISLGRTRVSAQADRVVRPEAGQRRHSRGRTGSSAPTGISLGRTRVSAQAGRVVRPEAGLRRHSRGRTGSSAPTGIPLGRTRGSARADRGVRPEAGQSRPALRGEKYGVRPCRRRYATFKCYGVL